MTDNLHRLLADSTPVRDAVVIALALRRAEAELLEEIMATDLTDLDLDDDRTPLDDQPRRSFRMAIGAVAAAAALVAAVLAVGGEGKPVDETPDVASQPRPDIPRLLADVVPDGYELATTEDAPDVQLDQEALPDDLRVTGESYLYGDADADDPFASSDLVITTLRQSAATADGELAELPGGEVEVQVRGQVGRVCVPDACSDQGATTLRWIEEPGLEVSLRSRSIDHDQLLAIAEGLEISDEQILLGSLPPGLPARLDLLSRDSDQARNAHAVRRAATYRQPSSGDGPRPVLDDRPSLTVSARDGDEATVLWEVVHYDTRHRVDVRGHSGWFVSRPASPPVSFPGGGYSYSLPFSLVIWEEQPGVIVSVTATGSPRLAEDELLDIAESLRPATGEEWEAVLEDHTPIEPAEVEAYVPNDAVAYVITDQLGGAAYLSPDGQVCGFVVDQDGKTPDACGPMDRRVHEVRDRDGEVRFLVGTMPEGAVSVAASNRYSDADALSASHDVPLGQDPRLYALPLDVLVPETITFLGRDGQPVETVTYP